MLKPLFYPLALGLLLALGGCGKDEPAAAALVLTGTYESTATLRAAEPITMYTANGQVSNDALIDHFLVRCRATAGFSRTDQPAPTPPLRVAIAPSRQVTFTSSADTLQANIIDQSAQHLLLAVGDSLSWPAPVLSSTDWCGRLAASVKRYYPAQRYVEAPAQAGTFVRYGIYRPVRMLTIRDGELYVPLFSWVVKAARPGQGMCYQYVGFEWNAFNPAVRTQLAAGDTIVVQGREVALRRL
jgi:hypothetical protein